MPPENKSRPLNEVHLIKEDSEVTRVTKRTVILKGSEKTEDLLDMAAKQLETD